ncbi:MAG TPA: lysoplasmalogenase [Armatimonadota bacterium]
MNPTVVSRSAASPKQTPRFGPLDILAIIIAAVSGAFYLAHAGEPQWVRLLTKALPVLCLAFLARRGNRLILAGLLASAAGDVALELWFVPGVLAFLTAHVFYIAAFVGMERRLRPLHALPFAAWAAAAYTAVHMNLGAMAAPVAVYIGVICAMMWRAAAQADRGRWAWLGLAGALMFGASDTLIALARWTPGFAASGLLIMALYWGGQALIAEHSGFSIQNSARRPLSAR